MELEQLEILLNKYRNLPVIESEKTIFDIGTRGHFENPTSDIIAFFCNSTEQHGMANLFGNSIIELINRNSDKNITETSLPITCDREVSTENNKRLDLVLEYNDYFVIIEVKVEHDQVNPFNEYESYGEKLGSEFNKEVFYAILSPSGKVNDPSVAQRWVGISFNDLKTTVSKNLHTHFMLSEINKWVFVLRDFLLHLERLAMQKNKNPNFTFALENMAEISGMWDLLIDGLYDLNTQITNQCKEQFGNVFFYKKETWFKPLPTFKYGFANSPVNVILFSSPKAMQGKRNEG
ncbi:PD-(D/E)XK nuclease family protein, partial [Vibrio rarus]